MSDSSTLARLVAVVPAAGIGRRMGGSVPKQYLSLAGKTVIEHAIQPLCNHPDIEKIVVAVGADDGHWPDLAIAGHPKVHRVDGGEERCHSVLNALNWLSDENYSDALVMVHDAARPCLTTDDLNCLIAAARCEDDGVLLGVPVRDTIKKVIKGSTEGSKAIDKTIDRSLLWRAQTPQMFDLQRLTKVLHQAIDQNLMVTDDASAMELAGFSPVMVEGSEQNIKMTTPEDLALAEYYLAKR